MKNTLILVEDTKWLEGVLAFKSLRYHQDGRPYGYFQLKIHVDKSTPFVIIVTDDCPVHKHPGDLVSYLVTLWQLF